MTRTGKRNLITDVEGLSVGQAEDLSARTGVTVVLAQRPFAAAVDVRGGAPGNAGAGLGAMAGTYKGGTGSASIVSDDGFTVAALAIVNAVGSPVIPYTDVFWAFPFEQKNEFGGRRLAPDFKAVDGACARH